MRLFLWLSLVAPLVLAVLAATAPAQAAPAPTSFTVYKDALTYSEIELRDGATGRVLERVREGKAKQPDRLAACFDSHFDLVGASWKKQTPAYRVNRGSAPSYLDADGALATILAGHEAWQPPLTTDCRGLPAPSGYEAVFSGTTTSDPSLAWLEVDGQNTVGFLPLAGTICDGPGVVACVVAGSDRGRFVEADFLLEADLAFRIAGDYRWTLGDRTWAQDGAGEVALIDIATHEWGHFAGLAHAGRSPELTMYPSIHDGMQTLGRGDLLGLHALYPAAGRGRG